MPEAVKRSYSSSLRTDQARATRRAIVAAAAELFVRDGYGATTIDAIASAAGVSRKTVFTSVGGKLDLLKLARDWAIVGDDEPIPMMERPHIKAAQATTDAREVLRMYVETYCESMARVAPINHVIESAAGLDDGVRALSDEGRQQRRFGMGQFAAHLDALGALREDLTAEIAGDLLWLFNNPDNYRRLVIQRQWPVERFKAWLLEALTVSVIAKNDRRKP